MVTSKTLKMLYILGLDFEGRLRFPMFSGHWPAAAHHLPAEDRSDVEGELHNFLDCDYYWGLKCVKRHRNK